VRLVQAAYNNRSLALYTKLGFNVQESTIPLVLAAGTANRPTDDIDESGPLRATRRCFFTFNSVLKSDKLRG
jgi:hypothetical protein